MGLVLSFAARYWKLIAIGLLFLAVHFWFLHQLESSYERGVAATQAAMDKATELQRTRNLEKTRMMERESIRLQTELEGKANANEIIADRLRAQLRASRVCSDDKMHRSAAGPQTAEATGQTTDAAGNAGPAETVGDRLVEIGHAAQDNTDGLIACQAFVTKLYQEYPHE